MSQRLEIEGIDASDLIERLAKSVLDQLRIVLAEKSSPILVDGDEMARLTGISRPMIDKLRAAGTIPSVMAGRRRLYRPEAVIDALTANENGGHRHEQ